MVEDDDFSGYGRIVKERFDLAVKHMRDAEVEPYRGASGEGDGVTGSDLLERRPFIFGQVSEFGRAGVEGLEVEGNHLKPKICLTTSGLSQSLAS